MTIFLNYQNSIVFFFAKKLLTIKFLLIAVFIDFYFSPEYFVGEVGVNE